MSNTAPLNEPANLRTKFHDLFGVLPEFVVRAPGRVNLIGEHTDYNDGFVFPAAIDRYIVMAGSVRRDRQVRAFSVSFNQSATFSLDNLELDPNAPWSSYIRGVAQILQVEGNDLRGINVVVDGTVPIGSGLSSSAAMEMSACLAFEAAADFNLDPVKRAQVCLRAEREFVGVNCGIMDQFISSLGREDHALLIDTRSLGWEAIPLPPQISIVVSDTNIRRGLVDSEYNQRRKECEEAVRMLQTSSPGIFALRDVTFEDLEKHKGELPESVYRRARHVVTENKRVIDGIAALRHGDISEFGRLMNDSHRSLKEDYEVSCPELDALSETARGVNGCFGSRMTGAGFGGCTISLVAETEVECFRNRVSAEYRRATGLETTIYVCRASDGAQRIH